MLVTSRQIPCIYKDTTDVKLQKLADIKIKMALTKNKSLVTAMELVEAHICDEKPVSKYCLRLLSVGATGAEKEAFDVLFELIKE